MLDDVRRILIVEDEGFIRDLLVGTFADAGFDVLEATSGDEAVRLLDDPDNVDLVLTDIQMPGHTDGNLVADTAKKSHPDLPVIYMTGNPSSLRNAVGTRDAFIRKPFNLSEVLIVVKCLLSIHYGSHRLPCRTAKIRPLKS
jgi:DNA-binding response OmpR family regulator